ncbi:sulfite exporter TauE/SafE family protein, partial [Parafrankia sp. EUN1f]|uniref:sulfite exporter TauE/SafE family protein n=1 Tax=Parafrankia sp. EUN1f TaxID=102897 RepID=UPI0001C46D70
MGPADAALVAGGGLLAGAVNAIAGGGTLIAFPALLATGMPALTANITSSVGLVTGYAGGALGYRRELRGQTDRLKALAPPAMLGGLIGAIVLLLTPSDGFKSAVPFLVLAACLLLAVQSRLAAVVARRRAATVAAAVATAARPT